MIFKGRYLQYFVFFGGSFNVLLCGLHFGWTSPFLPQLLSSNSTIPVTDDEGSWIASMFLIGGICGSILAASVFDIIGRKKSLVLTGVIFLPSWLMIAFARSSWQITLARFIAGISDGIVYCCMPLYYAEIGDCQIRGFLISGIAVVYFIGAFLINLLGSYFSMATIALACAVFTCLGILVCLCLPESPHYFMLKNDETNARLVIQQFYGSTDVEEPLNLIKKTLDEKKLHKGKWLQLFTDASNRKTLLLVIVLVLVQQCNGILGIMFYIQTLFETAVEGVTPIMFVSIYFILQILTSVANATIIDRVGRRPLLLVSIVTVIIALSVVSVYFTIQNVTQIDATDYYWFPISGFFLFIVGYTIGLHNVPIILGGELFPLHVKAFAVCILDIFYCVSGIVVSKFFQYTKDKFGEYVPFIVFTICSMCGLPFIYYFVPETKKKTLEEIQMQLRSKKLFK